MISKRIIIALSTTLLLSWLIKRDATNGASAQSTDWYSTFTYNGEDYAWSHEFNDLVTWNAIIPSHLTTQNNAPDGNRGEKGQDWCNNLVQQGSNSHDKNYSDWFLPNFEEATAGVSANPLPAKSQISCECCQSESDCHPNYHLGCWNMRVPALWTSSSCSEGTTSYRRAYFVHKSTIADDNVLSFMSCPEGSNYCCLRKTGYSIIHTCPQARCVRLIRGSPDPTPTPTNSILKTLLEMWGEESSDPRYDKNGDSFINGLDFGLELAN